MRGNRIYEVSKGLQVRPITPEDTPYIVAWRNQDFVRDNFIFQEIFTEEIHENWLASKVATGEVEQFIIEECRADSKEDAIPIGSIYFRDVDYGAKEAEYGIFLGVREKLGQGIGSQIAKWAVWYAKEELQLDTLILRVFADNLGARKSYEKAGFMETQYLPAFREEEKNHQKRIRDLVLMKIELRGA